MCPMPDIDWHCTICSFIHSVVVIIMENSSTMFDNNTAQVGGTMYFNEHSSSTFHHYALVMFKLICNIWCIVFSLQTTAVLLSKRNLWYSLMQTEQNIVEWLHISYEMWGASENSTEW